MTRNQAVKPDPVKETFVFFAITLGFSFFVFWGPLALFKVTAISFVDNQRGPAWAIALFMLGGFVPSLTAVALTGVKEGKPGLKRLWLRVIQVRIGWRWYLTGVLLVIWGIACQILLNNLLGATFDLTLFLAQLPSLLPLIVIGPLSEELGWRGYAQTRLQTCWNPLASGIVVGMAWALWHWPLFLMVGTSQHELNIPFMGFFCGVTALAVLFAWLQNNTGQSIWTAIFFHWIYTYASQVVATGVRRSSFYNWIEYTPYILAAIVIALVWNKELKTNLQLEPEKHTLF